MQATHELHTIMDERMQDHVYRKISPHYPTANYNVVGRASHGCNEVSEGPWPVTCPLVLLLSSSEIRLYINIA